MLSLEKISKIKNINLSFDSHSPQRRHGEVIFEN